MRLWALASVLAVAFSVACSQRQPKAENEAHSATPQIVNSQNMTPQKNVGGTSANSASVSGTVYFRGTPPQPVLIDMSADSGCRGTNYAESLVVNDGKLENVFVYLDGGVTFLPSPEPVIVEQRGCRYVPHVVAAKVTQPIEFRNLDPTNHNIHGMPHANIAWNASQPLQAPPQRRLFGHAEAMIPVKCNQHPWMKMYINVSQSPFYAVTDAQGHFEFRDVPPGTYDLVFVHESLGEQRHSIIVVQGKPKIVDVSFAR